MNSNNETRKKLFAGMVCCQDQIQVCVIDKIGNRYKILKSYQSELSESVKELSERMREDFADNDILLNMGLDSKWLMFCKFKIPLVSGKQLQDIIKHQVEAVLPVPSIQVFTGSKILSHDDKQMDVVSAVCKTEMASSILGYAHDVNAEKIILNDEGFICLIREISDISSEPCCVLRCFNDGVSLCFAENGLLTKAVWIDIEPDYIKNNLNLFCMDLQTAIDDYQLEIQKDIKLYVLKEDERICQIIKSKGLDADLLDLDMPKVIDGDIPKDLLDCIGLAIMALNEDVGFDIFRGVYSNTKKKEELVNGKQLSLLAVAACLLLFVYAGLSYGIDKLYHDRLESAFKEGQLSSVYNKYQLREAVSGVRVDIPELLSTINEALPNGITVEEVIFKRYQPVLIKANSKDPKQMYAFLESLNKSKDIANAEIKKQDVDSKSKQTCFTMKFDYKKFTTKKRLK